MYYTAHFSQIPIVLRMSYQSSFCQISLRGIRVDTCAPTSDSNLPQHLARSMPGPSVSVHKADTYYEAGQDLRFNPGA